MSGERLADIRAAGSVLAAVSTLLDQVDWDQLATDCNRAGTLGPILMPSEFQAGHERLHTNEAVIRATRTYLAELRRHASAAGET